MPQGGHINQNAPQSVRCKHAYCLDMYTYLNLKLTIYTLGSGYFTTLQREPRTSLPCKSANEPGAQRVTHRIEGYVMSATKVYLCTSKLVQCDFTSL